MIPSGKRGPAPANYGGDVGKGNDRFRHWLGWREWVVIASALAIAVGVAAILSSVFRSFIANSATAAWVQALGSIIAIAVAISLSRRQTNLSMNLQKREWKRLRKDRQRHSKQALQAVSETAHLAAFTIIKVCNAVASEIPCNANKARAGVGPIQSCARVLDKLIIHEFPGSLLAHHVLDIGLRADECVTALNLLLESTSIEADVVCRERLERITARVSKIRKALEETTLDYYVG